MRFYRFLSGMVLVGVCLVFLQSAAMAQTPEQEAAATAESGPWYYQNHPIRLLQPLNGSASTSLNPEPGIDMLYTYFNYAWPWVIGSAAGVGVLQALVGGIQIMMSGGKAGKEEGKTRLLWALAGLLMVGLAGLILETLNPLFYNQT